MYVCVHIYSLENPNYAPSCPKGLSGFHLMQHKIHIPCSGLHGPA